MADELTWNDMFNYLIKQENCIIEGYEIKVLDLHKTLQGFKESIELHEEEKRSQSLYCRSLKNLLNRIYQLHKQNKFKVIKER